MCENVFEGKQNIVRGYLGKSCRTQHSQCIQFQDIKSLDPEPRLFKKKQTLLHFSCSNTCCKNVDFLLIDSNNKIN